jgi:hypothetical protein
MVGDELGVDEDVARRKLEANGWSVRRAIGSR